MNTFSNLEKYIRDAKSVKISRNALFSPKNQHSIFQHILAYFSMFQHILAYLLRRQPKNQHSWWKNNRSALLMLLAFCISGLFHRPSSRGKAMPMSQSRTNPMPIETSFWIGFFWIVTSVSVSVSKSFGHHSENGMTKEQFQNDNGMILTHEVPLYITLDLVCQCQIHSSIVLRSFYCHSNFIP